jgi:hypothetical protein
MPINQTSVWNGSQWVTMGGVVDTASNYNWAGSHNFAQSAIFQDDVRIKSLNTGPLAGFRNKVVNGGFDIWQRGTSISGASHNAYTADQWININDSVGTTNISRQDIASQGIGLRYAARFEKSTGASNRFVLINLTEGALSHVGKQVTLSFWLRKGSGLTSGITASIGTRASKYGTVYDDGSFGILNSQLNTSTFTRFSSTFTITSATANAAADLFEIEFSAIQAGGTGSYFEIAGVQLEAGPVATPFENRHYGTELALCQRYYYTTTMNKHLGAARDSGLAFLSKDFPVQMRSLPSFSSNVSTKVGNGVFPGTVGQVGFYGDGWIATNGSALVCASDGSTADTGAFYIQGFAMTTGKIFSIQTENLTNFMWSAEL